MPETKSPAALAIMRRPLGGARGIFGYPLAELEPRTIARSPLACRVHPFARDKSRILFASLLPRSARRRSVTALEDLLDQLSAFLSEHGFERCDVVKQNLFCSMRAVVDESLIQEFYAGGPAPSTSIIGQPPASGAELALEVLAIRGENVAVERVTPHLTVVQKDGCRWAYVGGITPSWDEKETYGQALSGFTRLQQQLVAAGFHFNQVVRTWIYQRCIIAKEHPVAGPVRQRYQIMNDARKEFFQRGNNGDGFAFSHQLPPASTGIGMSSGSFVMECLALDVQAGMEIRPLRNPEQIDAHSYSDEVLENGAVPEKSAPLFSRGMSIGREDRMLLISGTAAIKGQETVCVDDPAGQTRTTIENIALVLQEAGASLSDVQQVRVYIKNGLEPELSERTAIVRREVEKALAGVPTLYLIADVCRDKLLVEIEALCFR